MSKLRFGPGGIPLTTKKSEIIEGIKRVYELGLDAMELGFVHNVFVKDDEAPEVKKVSRQYNVKLTIHGSYYINLASKEKSKYYASINRIISSAKIGHLCGAESVTFHPAFIQGRKKQDIYKQVKEGLTKVFDQINIKKYKIKISPELTGKPSQFGEIKDLVKLVKGFKKQKCDMGFCLDFAHNYARSNGKNNTKKEIVSNLNFIESELGRAFLEDMHIHISGMIYSKKGERYHVTLLGSQQEYEQVGIEINGFKEFNKEIKKNGRLGGSRLDWRMILEVLKEKKVGGIVICETPSLEQDALLMKSYYNSL